MDFLDPKKKRAHRIRLFIGYGLMAIAIGIGTMILVFAASGYGVDRNTGAVIQNGLVFVDSHPVSATVYVNGESKGDTAGRYILQEGKYTVELKRDGYRPWRHDITLYGGSVERLVYPFLFPTKLVSSDAQVLDVTPDIFSTSPDRHWILTHTPTALNRFYITDTSTKNNQTSVVTLPTAILSAKPEQSLSIVEWSTDNRHVLLKHTFQGGNEYIVFDRQNPSQSINLTAALGHAYDDIRLRDKQYDEYYVMNPGDGLLEATDIKAKTLTPIASHVIQYFPYQSDTVMYVTTTGAAKNTVMARMVRADKTYNIRQLPAGQVYLLNYAQFNGHDYAVAGSNADGKAYVFKDPLDELTGDGAQLPLADVLLQVDAAHYVSFSANARFITVQGGSTFATYDIENSRQIRYDIKLPLDGANQQAEWMDGHRLSVVSHGKLNIFDFDGTNLQTLNAVSAPVAPGFDRDYTKLFTISPSQTASGKPALVSTDLKVD